jgi:hypothetical protein
VAFRDRLSWRLNILAVNLAQRINIQFITLFFLCTSCCLCRVHPSGSVCDVFGKFSLEQNPKARGGGGEGEV